MGDVKTEKEDDCILVKHTTETRPETIDQFVGEPIVKLLESSDEMVGIDRYVEYKPNKWMLRLNYNPTKRELFRLALFMCGMGGSSMLSISENDEEIDNMTEEEIIERGYKLETSRSLVDSKEELRRLVLSDDANREENYSEFDL